MTEKELNKNIVRQILKRLEDALEHERGNYRDHPREYEEALRQLKNKLLDAKKEDDSDEDDLEDKYPVD